MKENLRDNIVFRLNASAGSGKTYALTNSFVDLLFESELVPCKSCELRYNKKKFNFSELLAITFTNLAANQMKEKVIDLLKDYALKRCKDRSKNTEENSRKAMAMLDAVFRQYGALNIRTIDSLLNQIVGLFALELGFAPNFEPRFDSSPAVLEYYDLLAELGIDTEKYAGYFEELCRSAFYTEEYDSFFAKSTLVQKVQDFIRYSIANNDYFTQETVGQMEKDAAFFREEQEKCGEKLEKQIKKFIGFIEKKKLPVKAYLLSGLNKALNGDYSSSLLYKTEQAELLNGKDKTADPEFFASYQKIQELIGQKSTVDFLAASCALSLPVVKICVTLNQLLAYDETEKQWINTQKIPYIIASLLGIGTDAGSEFLIHKKQEEVLLSAAFCRLGTRLRYILYDEFQDTSEAQWKALKDLSSEAYANGGSVLFVGDVKQAIYGWRGGNSALFGQAPKQIVNSVMEDDLPDNWRSCEHIIHWNNGFFANFAKPALLNALAFWAEKTENRADALLEQAVLQINESYKKCSQNVPENASEEVRGKGTVQVHYLNEAFGFFNAAVLALLPEAVKNLAKRHEYRDIAVLTATNEQASFAAQVLMQHDIPVVSMGSLGLKEHPLIADLTAFLRFLSNPLDDSAFCHVLLSRNLFPKDFYEKCPPSEIENFLAEPREASCFTAFRKKYPAVWQEYFYALVDGASLLTAYDSLCEIYLRLNVTANNPDAEVYLLRLKELAYLAEEQGIVDLNAFLAWWDENGEKEKAPLPENLNSVSVLTIHKSKGLEYGAVIVPWHNLKIEEDRDIHKISVPYQNKNYTLFSKLKKEHGEPYYAALLEKLKENINVLYVAWTRAKKELHVFMPRDIELNNKKGGYFYHFLQIMLEQAKEDFALKESSLVKDCGDCWQYGEDLPEPLVSEKSLRALEYAFPYLVRAEDAENAEEAEDAGQAVSEDDKRRIDRILADYREETDKGIKCSVPADDTLYVAKMLASVLNAPQKKKEKEQAAENAAEAPKYDQEHSMSWLPELRIFTTDLRELAGQKELSSNKRGTLFHKSLEFLVFSGNVREDCRRACFEAIKYLPYGRFAEDGGDVRKHIDYTELYEEMQDRLRWFAELSEPFGGAEFWLGHGRREHSLLDASGDLFRVDLLVEIPEKLRKKYRGYSYIAIDYKTGYTQDELPNGKNREQILNYVRLLEEATGEKAAGLLVYLDAEQCCVVGGEQ